MTSKGSGIFIGLMSGTCMDSIDAIAVDLNYSPPKFLYFLKRTISATLRSQLLSLAHSTGTLDQLGRLDKELGQLFAQATLDLLAQSGLQVTDIEAIGSHGQTVLHRPNTSDEMGYSLQIGDPNSICELTGITTVADFRRRDIAAGGEGAPLTPAFHKVCFQQVGSNRLVINIGGMANMSFLPASGEIIGFDSGPGNVLMDYFSSLYKGQPFDDKGGWASQGQTDELFLNYIIKNTQYFKESWPKSTGRELFDGPYIQQLQEQFEKQQGSSIESVDLQATMLSLTARTIADSISQLPEQPQEIYVCGGGAQNDYLMRQLEDRLKPCLVTSTAALGVDPKHVECMAFAWLAQRTLNRQAGNLSGVTGARYERPLGGIYYP